MSVLCCCRARKSPKEPQSAPGQTSRTPSPIIPPVPPVSPAQQSVGQETARTVTPLPICSGIVTSHALMPLRDAPPADLGELVVEDSDTDDDEDVGPKRSTGTLDAVRTKFIRHLSQDSDSKRSSRVSIGTSEPEVARRVELKRIMHKRIREELKSEEGHDEPSSNHRYLGPPIDLSLPGGGPRDTIEFTVVDIKACVEPDSSKEAAVLESSHATHVAEQVGSDKRRSSYPESPKSCESARQLVLDDRGSLPDLPPTPGLPPARPPSVHDTISLKSWRLSHEINGGDQIINVDSGGDPRPSQSQEEASALSTWLMAQGLRSREQSFSELSDSGPAKSSGTWDPDTALEHDVVAVKVPESAHLRGMDMSEMIHSPARNSVGSLRQDTADISSEAGPIVLNDPVNNQSLTVKRDKGKGKDTEAHRQDASSSKYPSLMNSIQPTPSDSDSKSNHFNLDAETLQTLQLSPFKWNMSLLPEAGDLSDSPSSYKTAQDAESTGSLDVTGGDSARRPTQMTAESCSIMLSETSSFQQREAELKTIEKRFADVLTWKKPRPVVASRFKENFDSAGHNSADQRASILSKLYLSIPRRGKGNSGGSEEQDMPATPGAPGGLHPQPSLRGKKRSNLSIRSNVMAPISSSASFQPPPLQESATQIWQRAIKAEADGRVSHQVTPEGADSQKNAESAKPQASLTVGSWRGGVHRASSFLSLVTSPSRSNLTPLPDEFVPVGESPRPRSAMQRWRPQKKPHAAGGEAVARKVPSRLATPPESWARWPSHSRSKRAAAAGSADEVKHKDWAASILSPTGATEWATDRAEAMSAQGSRQGSRSLSGRLGKVMKKTGLTRLSQTRSGMSDDNDNNIKGRRVSGQVGKQLEYPELEILPTEGGLKELRALEQEIEHMKTGTRPRRCTSPDPDARSGVTLSSTLPMLIRQKEQAARHAEAHGRDRKVLVSEEIQSRPTTPAGVHSEHTKEPTTATTEHFHTPASRLAYPQSASVQTLRAEDETATVGTTMVMRRAKSATPQGAANDRAGSSRLNTRSATQPLMSCTAKLDLEFQGIPRESKQRAVGTGRMSVGAEST